LELLIHTTVALLPPANQAPLVPNIADFQKAETTRRAPLGWTSGAAAIAPGVWIRGLLDSVGTPIPFGQRPRQIACL